MGMSKEVAKAISDLIERKINELTPHVDIGVFVVAESIDTNLSEVISGGTTYRYVPKASSVGALTAGNQIYLLKAPGTPMFIIGKVSGNIKAMFIG